MSKSITNIGNPAEPPQAQDAPAPQKRGPGRPRLGTPVPIILSDEERAIAYALGDSNLARGARTALHLVARIGAERAHALAYPVMDESPEAPPVDSPAENGSLKEAAEPGESAPHAEKAARSSPEVGQEGADPAPLNGQHEPVDSGELLK